MSQTPDGELHQKSEEFVQNIVDTLARSDLFLQAFAYRIQFNPRPDDAQKLQIALTNVKRSVEEQLKNISDFESAYSEGKLNAAGENPSSVGAPGTWTGLIPIYGSGRSAINDFENDRYGWSAFNTVLAISDVFLVKDIIEAVAKGGVNIGLRSFKWSATRARLGVSRTFLGRQLEPYAAKGQQIHHWLFHQNQGIGTFLPEWLKNQAYNYLRIPMERPFGYPSHLPEFSPDAWHKALHGRGLQIGLLRRLWYGSPNWPKLLVVSYGGRATEYSLEDQ